MPSDINFIACLRLDHVPKLLFGVESYEKSTCDLCGGPIWLSRKAVLLVCADDMGKACTECIGTRLRFCAQILARPSRQKTAWLKSTNGAT